MRKEKETVKWYNNAYTITNLIIGLILLIILVSQSMALKSNVSSFVILRNVINYNSIYLGMLFYFILLKFTVGKKYFDYLNTLVVVGYLIASVTSLINVSQSFNLNSLLMCILNVVIFCYVFHTFFRSTRIWDDFKLNKSIFNEISNDVYFSAIVMIAVILLAVNLIFTNTISGSVIALFDCLYVILFGRYIYLYRDYLDNKKIDVGEEGNLEEYKDKVVEKIDEFSKSVDQFIDNTKIDEKIDNIAGKIVEVSKDVGEKVSNKSKEVLEQVDNFVDEKFDKKEESDAKVENEVKGKKKFNNKSDKVETNKKINNTNQVNNKKDRKNTVKKKVNDKKGEE